MKDSGKITFIGFIFLLLIVYGGFVAVKLIGAKITQSQINDEVINEMGILRGSGFTSEKGEQAIIDILLKHKCVILDRKQDVVEVTIDRKQNKIKYNFEYKIESDLILFKKIKSIKQNDDNKVRSYD